MAFSVLKIGFSGYTSRENSGELGPTCRFPGNSARLDRS
jgi:hypothetical protein